MKDQDALISAINSVGLSTDLIQLNTGDLFQELSNYLNHLVDTDFNKLVALLYRIDVSEQKVRMALANPPINRSAGEIIAQLIIDREQQKIEWRRKYRSGEI